MTRRYHIPVEHDGQSKVMVIGERVHREFEKLLSERIDEKLLDTIHGSAQAVLLSISEREKEKSRILTRYAEKVVNPDFYGTIVITDDGYIDPRHVDVTDADEEYFRKKLHDAIERSSPPAVIADPKMYPHVCPKCTAPAYIGFMKVDCSRKSCV